MDFKMTSTLIELTVTLWKSVTCPWAQKIVENSLDTLDFKTCDVSFEQFVLRLPVTV